MRKTSIAKAGIIGFSIFLLYKIFTKGSVLNNLGFSIKKVGYALAPNGFILTFFLTVTNTVNDTIALNRITGNLLFNNAVIGTVDNVLNITVPAAGETVLPVSVNLFFSSLVNSMVDLITGKLKGMAKFTFDGTATIENVPLPLTLNYSLA